MRVDPNPYPDLLASLNQTQQEINTDEEELSTGYSVNSPSDDPAAAALLAQNAAQTSQVDQYQRSIGSIQGEMQDADSALSSVVSALQQAITIGTEGANGTVNSSDREAIAVQVQGIQSQLLSLANLTYQGNYVFAGTATQSAPYVLDSTSSSGVTYEGNGGVNKVTLGNNFTLQTNLPGTQVFSSQGTDMFQAVQDLIVGLGTGDSTAIGTAVNELSAASQAVSSQSVFYGNALSQLNSQQTYLSTEATQLAQQQNTEGAADLPAVVTNLTTAETSEQATLDAVAQTANTNLFQYLR
jgi:flagellar hook-associated protein 3 FlgL